MFVVHVASEAENNGGADETVPYGADDNFTTLVTLTIVFFP